MPSLATSAQKKSQKLHAVVVRCGCGNPSSHAGLACPTPRASESLGVIAFWHRNPLIRLLYKLHIWKPKLAS